MEKLIEELIDRKASPKAIAAAIILSMRNGSYRKQSASQEYYNMWCRIINNDEVIQELWKFDFIEKKENLDTATIKSKFVIGTQDDMLEMAEEVWNTYPAVFPLSGGGSFLARKGTDKEEILKMYLDRIKNSTEKHQFVLEQLKIYIKLVFSQKINGHRIQEWISNEVWDTIPAIDSHSGGQFKQDI